MTVLLAEDDIDDQELLAEAFSEIDPDIRLIPFTSGRKFLSYLDEVPEVPDMVVLDYNIPEMNGAEILKHLQEDRRYHTVTKLVWSTSDSSHYERSCIALGAKAYLIKPTSVTGLVDLAQRMVSYVD
jgi:response regulator RpfG family c-di-GMP phosphodiesterase